jgi:uncharacterized protein (DUF952 family)
VTIIYKVCPIPEWNAAQNGMMFEGSPVDVTDGYIHFSTAAQVRETVRRHFAGQADLMLLAVDADSLGPALRWEPSRGGDLFPHLYGPLPVGCVVKAETLPLGADGVHQFPAEVA